MSERDFQPSTTWRHSGIQKVIERILLLAYRGVRAAGNRLLDQNFTNPRLFSNNMSRYYGKLLSGKVINVSGYDDGDKGGASYRSYFPHATSYTVSNANIADEGLGSVRDVSIPEIEIDLNKPIPENLRGAFDVVYNHTTLEHVFGNEIAFKNLCDLTSDAVVVIVPVLQQIHIKRSFGDYWRPTTLAIAKSFKKYGLEPLVLVSNNQPFAPIYCFALAVRDPKKYEGKIDRLLNYRMGDYLYGGKLHDEDVQAVLAE